MSFSPSKRTEVCQKKYKVVVDAEEGCRRREDNLVEIRKNKREENLRIRNGERECNRKLFLNRSSDLRSKRSDSEGSMNPDLLSALLNNDLEVTPERIRSFLPLVNWDRLASMYLSGRSGAECESRWLNCDDPLINHSPWTILEDKKLLFIVQERGIYNWIDIALMLGTQRTPFQCLARYQRSLNPHILNKEWTEDEDARLREAMEIFGDSNWQNVASYVEGRTGPQCSNRWRKTLNPERRKVGRWSVDEDKCLKVAVMLFGAKNWNKIALFAPGRTQVQCRERWLNCLDPSLKLEAWTEEEDAKLLAAIDEHGYCWSKVATCVPPRTDNQCMRRWKILLPHEVPLLRAARVMKRTVLVSNFVDRESERPAIGPSDFSSLENHPASDCGNGRRISKRRSREETRKENQREASCDKKIKKAKAKSRMSPQENVTETGGPSPIPAGTGASTNIGEIGSTKRGKSGPRVQKIKKSKARSRMSSEENVTGTGACTDTGEIGSTKRRRKRGPSDQEIKKSKAKSIVSSEENVTETGDLSLVPVGTETGDLSLVPVGTGACTDTVEIGSTKSRRKRGPRDNYVQFRRSSKSNMEDRMLMKESNGTDYTVDICADEDVPLKSWLESLALEARRKRSANKSSRSLAEINQKNTYCGVAEAIPSVNPGAKRKRSSRTLIKKAASRYENNSLSKDKNNRFRQPTLAQLVERSTVVGQNPQLSLGRWFESGSRGKKKNRRDNKMSMAMHANLHLHSSFLPRNIPSTSVPRRNIPLRLAVMASTDLLEAAKLTVDNYVKTGMTIGLGSGPASNFAIQHLGHKLREGSLTNILGIPTSISSAVEAEKAGITIDKLILHSSMLMLLRRGLWLQ